MQWHRNTTIELTLVKANGPKKLNILKKGALMSVKFNGIYINTGQIRARAGGGGNIAPLRVLANPSLLPQDINRFGWSTALYGNTAYITSPFDATGATGGKIYVADLGTMTVSDTVLEQGTTLTGGTAYDNFGWSAAVNSSYLAVGVPTDDTHTITSTVEIYNRGTGAYIGSVTNPDTSVLDTDDYFGWGVALSSNRLLVGAPSQTADQITYAGAAYVFDAATRAVVRTLTGPVGASNENFGWSVAASDTYHAVGVPANSDDDTARVDIFNASTGVFVKSIPAPNVKAATNFGWSVALSGGILAVGSPFEEHDGKQTGRVYVFNVGTGELTHTFASQDTDVAADGDNFGISVGINGNILAVGSANERLATADALSKIFVYNLAAF
jgi:hypothetical protein